MNLRYQISDAEMNLRYQISDAEIDLRYQIPDAEIDLRYQIPDAEMNLSQFRNAKWKRTVTMSKNKKSAKRKRIRNEVTNRGREVLRSDLFRRSMNQKHHNVTLGEHSIGVAEDSLKIADALSKLGLMADRDALVRSSLCHDFGMVDRYNKYNTNVDTCMRHPGESLKITQEMYPDITDHEKDSILHHMFPVLPVPPRTLEGAIVCIADKKSAIREEFVNRFRNRSGKITSSENTSSENTSSEKHEQ